MPDSSILTVKQLTLKQGARTVVDQVSMQLAKGSILAVLGPNGAGKSSLLKGILGILPMSAGKVSIAGTPLESLSPEQRAKAMAYVPQHSALHQAWSVRDVVRMGRFAHRHDGAERSREGESIVERSMFEMDILHFAERDYLTLSGGERSRVLIARALATEAPLLLLDEPTQSLDAAHAIDCMQHLQRLRDSGKSILLVTHDLNQITYAADEVLLLHAGQTCAYGPPKRIFRGRAISEVFGIRLVPEAAFGFARMDDAGPTPRIAEGTRSGYA
ncbi:MAG TPA: ABC transporter ATP-binding protein [Polyangiaceae bacterium]